jgi:hypothetical protein
MKTIANENLRIWPAKAFKLQTAFPCSIAVVVFAAVSAARAGPITNPPPEAVNDVLQRAPDAPVRVRIATLLANDRDAGHGPIGLVSVERDQRGGRAGGAARPVDLLRAASGFHQFGQFLLCDHESQRADGHGLGIHHHPSQTEPITRCGGHRRKQHPINRAIIYEATHCTTIRFNHHRLAEADGPNAATRPI